MKKVIEHYSLQNQLGSGIHSRVYRAINLHNNEEVAVKVIQASKFKSLPKLQEGIMNEINILRYIQPSPHIVKYYDMYRTSNNFYFIYEFCNEGTLEQLIKKQNNFTQKQTLIYLRQILQAFKILSHYNIMHRDIKPQNILLHNGKIKIADFGFCKPMEDKESITQTMLGSPAYMAPQILFQESYTLKADIWSLGVVIFQMLYGKFPYQSQSIHQLITSITKNDFVIPPEPKISAPLQDLLRKMIVKDRHERIDWEGIFKYQINQNGTIKFPKDLKITNSKQTLRLSGTQSDNYPNIQFFQRGKLSNSSNIPYREDKQIDNSDKLQNRSSGGNPQIVLNNRGYNIYSINVIQSPKITLDKFEESFKNYELAFQKASNISTSCRQQIEPKSPYESRFNRVSSHIKNHKKCIDIIQMSIQLLNMKIKEATYLAYELVLIIEKDLIAFLDSAKKQQRNSPTKNSQQSNGELLSEFVKSICQELQTINQIKKVGLQEINFEEKCFKSCVKNSLKAAVQKMNLNNAQERQLALRLIHYIEENFLLSKNNYQKMKQEAMIKEITSKISKIVMH